MRGSPAVASIEVMRTLTCLRWPSSSTDFAWRERMSPRLGKGIAPPDPPAPDPLRAPETAETHQEFRPVPRLRGRRDFLDPHDIPAVVSTQGSAIGHDEHVHMRLPLMGSGISKH